MHQFVGYKGSTKNITYFIYILRWNKTFLIPVVITLLRMGWSILEKIFGPKVVLSNSRGVTLPFWPKNCPKWPFLEINKTIKRKLKELHLSSDVFWKCFVKRNIFSYTWPPPQCSFFVPPPVITPLHKRKVAHLKCSFYFCPNRMHYVYINVRIHLVYTEYRYILFCMRVRHAN